ncbi:RING finger protein 122 isoform X1 [Salmo salar]|uniref:RING finger protein 122-like isoform X1 n=1 Tax=Salmo salar TaxID=8030 RepID=A0ABM3CQL3_SALSA|nr:RING finger protein 122-like isoform X1 [Salmo salar]XP_045548847.1 RING finger protein 122-like isoform X1 [Salmo salar]
MSTVAFQNLPLNIYMVIFGTGVFVFVLSLIFCCYFISKLRHQAQRGRFGYKAVVFKGDTKKLNLHGVSSVTCLVSLSLALSHPLVYFSLSPLLSLPFSQSQQTCAVCLEDFRVKDELGVLPCQHAFHRRCLVKWLEVRCVCPMCNKHIAGPPEQRHSLGTLLDELV